MRNYTNLVLKRVNQWIYGSRVGQLLVFGVQQALCCLFPVLVFSALALSHLFAGIIPRYDFMLIACIVIQVMLYKAKIEIFMN